MCSTAIAVDCEAVTDRQVGKQQGLRSELDVETHG